MAVCNCTGEHVDSPQDVQLMELLGHYRGYQGGLIPVLQGAQAIYGYLPAEVLEKISEELKIPFSEVFGVVTFCAVSPEAAWSAHSTGMPGYGVSRIGW